MLGLLGAVVWAVSMGTLPRADFVFNNGAEIKTMDPAQATGSPEGRVINALFEGLLRSMPAGEPDELGRIPMKPVARGMADRFTVTADGTVYRFHIREDARWTNGDPVTATDFAWSWMRFLHPETASEYNYQLFYVRGAEKFNTVQLAVGDKVEVELADRKTPELFPRGTIRRGILRDLILPAADTADRDNQEVEAADGVEAISGKAIFIVEFQNESSSTAATETIAYAVSADGSLAGIDELKQTYTGNFPLSDIQPCKHVLYDFNEVGIRVLSSQDLEVTLNSATAFFPELVAFYPLHPVHRGCVEQYGARRFTKAEHIVSNGPFRLIERRIRDRIRLTKNEQYWNAAEVELESIDVMSIQSETTSLNMYLTGQLDWDTTPPNTMIPILKKRDDFVSTPFLASYFYRVNTEKPPLNNPLVRRALNLAIDKRSIVDNVVKGGQSPASSFVPPGMNGYEGYRGSGHNVKLARQLLAEAGYPNGKGLPQIEILYNTADSHRDIAEVIQQDWKKNLGINVVLRNLEWGSFLDSLRTGDYMVARSGWIGDYPDPNTFLDMFVTGGPNNQTNWGNAKYDNNIKLAKSEPDPAVRMQLFVEAETILMKEQAIMPIYFYVSKNMVQPRIEGFHANLQDIHPLHLIKIRREKSTANDSISEDTN
ncbi:MAG: peptide ABC transporter substrate-binding protein [Planctomycetota bacterium]|nr:peptide ABC transporter substrate-binding protein [Planctomycetota bacterium]